MLASEWLAAHDADVRKAALEEAAQIAEESRPEMGPHIKVSLYREGKYDGMTAVATLLIRAAALGDAPTGGE